MKNLLFLGILAFAISSCGSPQSGWTEEEAINQLSGGCFDGNTKYGPQALCFNIDGTWYRNYKSGGITYGEMRGTWSMGEYNDEYDWWEILIDGGSSTTHISTFEGTGSLYVGGWNEISSGTKDYEEGE